MGTKARSLSEAFTNDAFVLKDVSGYSGVDRIYFSDLNFPPIVYKY